MTRILVVLLLHGLLVSCATPRVQTPSSITQAPRLAPDRFVMDDGYELPLSVWKPAAEPRAVVLALHGFNDYRKAFSAVAPHLTAAGIQVYAYDQRGFGETRERGIWPGSRRLQQDAAIAGGLLCEKFPGRPLYLLGESMGAAVAMVLLADAAPGCIDGVLLVAPAVRGWRSMPLWQRITLWLAAHTSPAKTLTGKGLGLQASDNIEMLRAQGRDPQVIKKTRIDAMYGLVTLMDSALFAGSRLGKPALVLYGERDEIIPPHALCALLSTLTASQADEQRVLLYPAGYHMLTRDLQAPVVLQDMLAWLQSRRDALPSGFEVTAGAQRLQALCATS